MTVVDSFQDGGELAARPPAEAKAKHLGDLVGGQAEEAEITGALEQFVDGKVPAEDKVATVFDLLKAVVAWIRTQYAFATASP